MEFTPDGPMAIPMWVNGHAFLTVTPDFFTVTNPATGEGLRRVPLCGADEAAEAVKAAQAAQPAWAMMGVPARAATKSPSYLRHGPAASAFMLTTPTRKRSTHH